MQLTVESIGDVDRHLATLRLAADRTCTWLRDHKGDSMEMMRSMKFEKVGCHPLAGHALNVVEQINQTFTYMVALHAARHLLELHPACGPLVLAPGAHASLPLDIMSESEGLIGAETFAAVTPRNNGKLKKDLDKLAARPERHRYAYFASPLFPRTERLEKYERGGIQVWSLAL